MLRFLLESQTYWAEDLDGINPGLRSWEQVWDLAVPKTAAGAWMRSQLQVNGAGLRADPEFYDRFLARLADWHKDPIHCELIYATFLQAHPTKASAYPAFEWLQRYYDLQPRSVFLKDFFRSWTGY